MCPPKTDFVVSGRAECRDLLQDVVGHQGMKKNRTILLRESTFNLWNQRKIDLGFQGNTHSEFAEFLSHSLVQWHFEEESVRMDDGAEGKKNRTAANSKSKVFCFGLKAELALLFLCLIYLQLFVIILFRVLGISAFLLPRFR